jgi:hypothetical protein
MICGRTMHDLADGWGEDPGFGVTVFVVTHRLHDKVVKGNTPTIAPVLLGAGKRLFDGVSRTDLAFERTAVIESPYATHFRFRVVK